MGSTRASRRVPPSGIDLPAEAMRRAQAIFGNNLLAAFVGGSRATGAHANDSDIDAYVLIEHSDRTREVEYALTLKQLHDANGLAFDHYGEIFDRATLESLLSFTEVLDETNPEMIDSPCYRGNCLLSIYRKGRVVMEFLAAPKVHVIDPYQILPQLGQRSRRNLARQRVELPSQSTEVVLAQGAAERRLLDEWMKEPSRLDTPVGVELWRWFGRDLEGRRRSLAVNARSAVQHPATLVCPLSGSSDLTGQVYRTQCLSASVA